MESKTDPGELHNEPERWLCSQLVQLLPDEEPRAEETGLLEEISEEGAGLAVESGYPKGGHLTISAPGFQAHVVIVECSRRETDFHLETRFLGEFRWSPDRWTPDHLFRPPIGRRKAKKAAGRG